MCDSHSSLSFPAKYPHPRMPLMKPPEIHRRRKAALTDTMIVRNTRRWVVPRAKSEASGRSGTSDIASEEVVVPGHAAAWITSPDGSSMSTGSPMSEMTEKIESLNC